MALLNETEVATRTGEEVTMPPLAGGAVAGFVGGVVMGGLAQLMAPVVITEYIPRIVGLSGAVPGWIVHLLVATVFGGGYAALATETSFVERSPSVLWDAALGLGYGFVVWIVAMAAVMPLWLEAVGTVETLPVPWLNPMPLMAHLVYGLVVGVVFPLVEFE